LRTAHDDEAMVLCTSFHSTVSIEPIDSGTSGRGAKNKMSTTAVFVEPPRLSAEHIRFGVWCGSKSVDSAEE
jgi:hypothetical protein